MTLRSDPRTLIQRADLEDLAADRAAEIARHAEAEDHPGADTLWRLVRRFRVQSLKLRALAAAAKAREDRPGHL